MNIAQRRCSTINEPKNTKIGAGANFDAAIGKINVMRAEQVQCVNPPRDWPCALMWVGKTSAMITHMTVP